MLLSDFIIFKKYVEINAVNYDLIISTIKLYIQLIFMKDDQGLLCLNQ